MKVKRCFFSWLLAIVCLMGACDGDDDDDAGVVNDDDASPLDDDDDDAVADDDTTIPGDDDDDNDDDTAFDEPFDPTARGPYAVGNRTILFKNPSRFCLPSRGARQLLTEVWYPAPEWTRDLPRDSVDKYLGDWFGLIMKIFGYLVPPEELANFTAQRNSARDVPLRADRGPYPVVLISHGNAAIRFAHMSQGEYLASHGYIVAAPDHIGNAIFVTLPDRLVIYNPLLMPSAFLSRIGDMAFLADEFTRLNENDPEGFFTGLVDTNHIGLAGHSFGAVTGSEAAILDERFQAAVEMAAFTIPLLPDDFDTPFMFMMGAEDRTMGDYNPVVRFIDFPLLPAPKFLLSLYDAGHYTFTDACILIPSLMGDGDGCGDGTRRWTDEPFTFIPYEESTQLINTYLAAFYGYTLKGQEVMLDTLTNNLYPDEMMLMYELAE